MGVDELGFHSGRTVPRLEWLGHALDTSVFLVCLACPLLLAPTALHLKGYAGLAALSCLLVTKDELGPHLACKGGEHWVHAVLFLLHPVVLIATACLWAAPGSVPPVLPVPPAALASLMLWLQAALVGAFLLFQLLFGAGRSAGAKAIDNTIYDQLGERWYTATDDPVALLRAEARVRNAWVLSELKGEFGQRPLAILDVACGGGFLANPLAQAGHAVTGIDLSLDSLAVAQRHDATGSVAYRQMDARALAFPDGHFDVVCMMDFLEHLEERDEVLREAARVLKPGGWFFFHTFNRTPLSWLIAIKGVEWAVLNVPRNMHVYHLFLKPEELRRLCDRNHLAVEIIRGLRPRVFTWAFLKLLVTGRVSEHFQFEFTGSQRIGYCGRARRSQDRN
jgi:2-polyprenyl-6-hydroxyphenyl methylase/3-demethylubiquinone-9 3-methyltransferase